MVKLTYKKESDNMTKQAVLNILLEMYNYNEIDEQNYHNFVSVLNRKTDEEVAEAFRHENIITVVQLRNHILKHVQTNETGRTYNFNEYYYALVHGNTASIHFTLKDARHLMNKEGIKLLEDKFDDFMIKLSEFLKENPEVENVTAVSHLIRDNFGGPWFKKYGFDVKVINTEDMKNNEEMKQFYDVFANYNNKKRSKVGYAKETSENLIKKVNEMKLKETESKKNLLKAKKDLLNIKKEQTKEETISKSLGNINIILASLIVLLIIACIFMLK